MERLTTDLSRGKKVTNWQLGSHNFSGMMQTGFARRGHVAPTKWDFSSNRMEDVEAAAINGFRSNGKRYGDSFSWRNVGRTDPPEVFGGLRNLVNIS